MNSKKHLGYERSRAEMVCLIESSAMDTIHDHRSLNGFGELQSRLATAYGTDLLSMEYAYDTVGRITSCTERVYFGETNTFSYAYDSAGRLSEVRTNGGLHATYQYDANGNRTNAIVGGVTSTGQVDNQDRLLSYGSATYQYDNHGTLTNKTDGGQTTAYQYDARGSLLGVTQGTNLISYGIDPLGRRISRTKNGTTTQRFVYQGFLSPVAELNADGSVASRFVYATRANVPDYMVQGSSTYRIITDIRGSVRLVVNADTRVIVQRMDYDEWGNVTQDTNPGFQPFGFAGGLYDPDTGLVRFGFRDYDPEVGRWIARDPILFAGGQANLYLYCHGDSVNYTDLLGLSEDMTIGVGWSGNSFAYGAIGDHLIRLQNKYPNVRFLWKENITFEGLLRLQQIEGMSAVFYIGKANYSPGHETSYPMYHDNGRFGDHTLHEMFPYINIPAYIAGSGQANVKNIPENVTLLQPTGGVEYGVDSVKSLINGIEGVVGQ